MPYEKPEVRDARDRVGKNLKLFYFSNAGIGRCVERATPSVILFLDDMLRDELERRNENRKARMVRNAGFPVVKSLDDYDFSGLTFPSDMTRQMVVGLDFVRDKHSLVLYGVCGSGKTMLAVGLGMKACMQGLKVRFFTLAQLSERLRLADEEGRLGSCYGELAKLDLLILDELGYCRLDREGAQRVFQVIADSYERKSLIVTTNLPFSQWGKIVTDEQLATAMIDRIVHYGHLITTGDRDWRLAHSPMNVQIGLASS